MNVVSLLPSATEMLYLLDVEPVGVSHGCDHPPDATRKPSVTTTSVTETASTKQVNQEVEEAVDGDGVYDVDVDMLQALDPDVVVTQDVCDVCAVDSRAVETAVEAIPQQPQVVDLHSHTFEGVLNDVLKLGEAVDAAAEAEEAVEELRRRAAAVERTAAEEATDQPRTLLIEWLDPPMVAGHWTPELVEKAGGWYGVVEASSSSEAVEWETVTEFQPEKLLVAPCGFEVQRTTRELHLLTERSGWKDLPAVRRDEVYVVDGHHLVNRPGPRLVETLERLGEILHPDVFGEPKSPMVQQPIRIR